MAGCTLLGVLAAVMLRSGLAVANDSTQPARDAAVADQDALTAIGLWFDRQVDALKATFNNANKRFDNFGHEAGVAARATVNGAKDAAHAVARLPNARVVSGYAKCRIAANGAPDCVSAADAVCKTKGFTSGKSVDMTTAEVCPPKVWMSGRNEGAGCHTETFVSSALCQ
jgi:hypothetical protein